jgi:hypothetical protein
MGLHLTTGRFAHVAFRLRAQVGGCRPLASGRPKPLPTPMWSLTVLPEVVRVSDFDAHGRCA